MTISYCSKGAVNALTNTPRLGRYVQVCRSGPLRGRHPPRRKSGTPLHSTRGQARGAHFCFRGGDRRLGRAKWSGRRLADSDLSEVFGVELDTSNEAIGSGTKRESDVAGKPMKTQARSIPSATADTDHEDTNPFPAVLTGKQVRALRILPAFSV